MNAWIVILAVGAGTYLFRASMFVVLGQRSLPAWTTTPMGLVAPAAVAALVASLLFTSGGQIEAVPAAEIAAVAVGFLAVRRSGNVMHAFVAGMPVVWILDAVLI
jgi:branched-subunit amino acid transport protein